MAVGTYTLPICDGCNLPWLPARWKQDSDPRNLPTGTKPLRCGKCKSIGWDREHNKRVKMEATETAVNTIDPTKTVEMPRNVALEGAIDGIPEDSDVPAHVYPTYGGIDRSRIPEPPKTRCKHRMTNCPICNPKEAA